MDDIDTHPRAALLRMTLLALLGLAALLIAVSLLRDLREAATVRWGWERHPAEVTNTADPQWVELEVAESLLPLLGDVARPEMETPFKEGHVRILLPRPAYVWYDVFDTVDIARDPAQPGALTVIDLLADALPPLVKLVWLAGLGGIAWLLWRARWAEDLSWSAGDWVSTAQTPSRPGANPSTAEPALYETRASHRAVLFWTGLTGVGVVIAMAWAFLDEEALPLEAGSILLVVLGIFGLVLRTAVGVFTRRVRQDTAGICDRDFFRTRRVAWKEISHLRRVNLNEDAQRRYDHQSKRSGNRPQDLTVWKLLDGQEKEMLRFSEDMAPPEAFAALRQRIMQGLAPQASGAEGDTAGDADAAQFTVADWVPPELDTAPRSLWAPGNRGMVLCLAVLLVPLLLGTAYSSWNSLWFLFGAATSQGTVVEKNTEDVPSVTVAYTDAQGNTLRTESAGSDFYADIAVGDAITVYYDPVDPAIARIDLFLEIWIVPMLLGSVTLILLLATAVVVRLLQTPFGSVRLPRKGGG